MSLCLVSGRLLICVCWSGLTSRQEGSPLQLSRTPILCSSLLSALWIIGICYLALYPWIFEFLNNIWIFKCLNYILNATHQEMKMSKKFQEEPSHSMLWLALISIHEIFVCICIWQAWISTHKLRYMSNIAVLTSFKLNLTVSFYSTRQTGREVGLSVTEVHCRSLPASFSCFILCDFCALLEQSLVRLRLWFLASSPVTHEAVHLPRCCQKQGTSAYNSRTQFVHHPLPQVEHLPCLQIFVSLTPCFPTLVKALARFTASCLR